MSTQSRNWVKFTAAIAFTFTLSVFFARLFDLPAVGLAQSGKAQTVQRAAIIPVSAPQLADTRTLTDLSEAYAAVTAAVRPSVVFIEADEPVTDEMVARQLPPGVQMPRGFNSRPQMARSIGSGFIVSSDGYIVTNHHVIEGATKIRVKLLDDREFTGTVVGSDRSTDIGVIKIDAKGLQPAALGSSDKVRIGEWVLAVGNPLGEDLTFSVTQGIISAKGRAPPEMSARDSFAITDFLQTDAVINQGSSGGPLLNVRGEVIGINSAIASTTGSYQGYALAIPIDLASQVMNQIIAHGKFERSVLGIRVATADADDAAYLGLPTIGGVTVSSFPDNSPAKLAGLQVGDVIVSVDGAPVKYTAQLQQIVGFHRPGDLLKVEVVRKSGHKEFSVKAMAAGTPEPAPKLPATPAVPAPTPVVAKNKLGVLVEPLTPALIAQLKIPATTSGLRITDIVDGAPAESKLDSKLSNGSGSIILEVEGKPVRTEDDLKASLSDARNGVVTLTLLVDRAGTTRMVRVRLMQ